ncbi:60S ribosomal protein L35a-1 [Spatholobus suberectus]|nr:60S ribosomal protein L35a-1 [Spatholobus suberectus]
MAYIYKAKVKKEWKPLPLHIGQGYKAHGNSGIVCAKFKSNLPPRSMIVVSLSINDL